MNKLTLIAKSYLKGFDLERSITIKDGDVFLVSYPKSGNTWMRFVLANLKYPNLDVDFSNIDILAPQVYEMDSNKKTIDVSGRILKSHLPYDRKYGKVVLLVRDPRSVALSYFHHFKRLGKFREGCSLGDFIDRFLSGVLDNYGNWGVNVGSWYGASKFSENILLVRYEDVLASFESSVEKIFDFIGLDLTDQEIAEVKQKTSLDRLKAVEQNFTGKYKGLPAQAQSDQKDMFFRKGDPAEWKSSLSTTDCAKIEAAWGELMTELGYELFTTTN